MLHEAGSLGSSPASLARFPLGCWWKTAGGRLPPFFFLPSLPPYSSPCQTRPCYHGNTGRAEPWERGMQTEERSTPQFPQSTGRRESPSTQPKTEMDQRDQNSVAFNTVLYLHCKSGFIIHIFFCVCVRACVSLQKYPRTAVDSEWTSVPLTFLSFFWYLFCNCLF